MDQDQATPGDDKSLVSTRVMDVATALFFILVGGIVIFDSVRLGADWGDMGPEPGYFPFYIGCFLIFAGALTAVTAIVSKTSKASGDAPFVTVKRFSSVLKVFIPTVAYVALMSFIGLYSAAAIFIIGFMMVNGGYSFIKALPYGVIVPVLIFVMFEVWFLVPLPKGPIETMLGF